MEKNFTAILANLKHMTSLKQRPPPFLILYELKLGSEEGGQRRELKIVSHLPYSHIVEGRFETAGATSTQSLTKQPNHLTTFITVGGKNKDP